MRFCALGSGSRGNAYLLEKADTTFLVECGFSPRGLKKRLLSRYVSPAEITAAFISHEHGDHIAGIQLLIDHNIPIHMSAGTARALGRPANWQCITPHQPFSIGGLTVEAFPVPHDVEEPMQFVFDDGSHRLAIVTDLGHVPPALRRLCGEVDALVLECNYDEHTLRSNSKYPEHVKERIAGDYGHLSNRAAAALVSQTKTGKPRKIIAAHLSENNNTEVLVRKALTAADSKAEIHIATQETGTDWLKV